MDAGNETIAVRSTESLPVKFYASWRCPYSQRVWIGLEEKVVDYQWVEINVYGPHDDVHGHGRWHLPLAELRSLYPAFVQSSPSGRLPALDNDGERVCDSVILLEYLHDAFGGAPLLPPSPYLRSQVRLWTRHVDTQIVPHYERLLASPDACARSQARGDLLRGLADFEAAMAPETEGPFFLGDDFSMADIALAPWWQRMCTVLRAYRKFDPSQWPRLQRWFEAVEVRPSYQRTVVDPERLIEEYSDCADLEAEGTKFRRGSTLRAALRGH